MCLTLQYISVNKQTSPKTVCFDKVHKFRKWVGRRNKTIIYISYSFRREWFIKWPCVDYSRYVNAIWTDWCRIPIAVATCNEKKEMVKIDINIFRRYILLQNQFHWKWWWTIWWWWGKKTFISKLYQIIHFIYWH